MKFKTLFILTLATTLVACQKDSEFAEVSFRIGGIPTGDMPTKTLDSDAVAAAFDATLPGTDAYLTIKSKTNSERNYNASVGESVTLALDSYTVTGTWNGGTGSNVYLGKLYNRPKYTVSDEITVTGSDDAFTLDASWACFALIFDSGEVASVSVTTSSATTYEDLTAKFTSVGDLRIAYFFPSSSWSSSKPLSVKIIPTDTVNYEEKTFTFTTAGGGTLAEYGKWYYLSPAAVETSSGDFDFQFPDWEQGEE